MIEDLLNVYKTIKPFVHKTPVLTSQKINELFQAHCFFKCENFQKTGSYKIRGATNAIYNLSTEQKKKGVVTHSSGNFAQALSKAALNLGVKAQVVMPKNAPKVKQAAVKGYGGIVSLCSSTLEARERETQRIIEKYGSTFIHPSNQIDVINGQGTACYELLQETPDLDVIIVPVGGGGLLAGTLLFASEFSPNTKVIAAEPFEVDDAYRSIQSGKIESNITTNTIADGLKTQLGDVNFPIIMDKVYKIIRVTEEEIVEAMKLIYQYLKIVIEPSSAVAVAAVLKQKEIFSKKNIGIVISGGNVDVNNLPF